MSYLLQGSGALLAPCFGSLGRELAKFAPCICIRCSRLIEIERGRGPLQTTRSFTSHTSTSFPLPSIPSTPSTSTNLPYIYRDVDDICHLRRQFHSDTFRQKYFTSFRSQLPLLGSTGPIAVNLNFTCAPDIPNTGIQYRFLHSSPCVSARPSSKLEESVERLKERQKETLLELSRVKELEKKIQNVIEKDEQLSQAVKVSIDQKKQLTAVEKKSLWTRFVEECKHYYSGFKLLFLDVRVSSKIIWKVLHGHTLSRRENRQLVRTVSDLFRLLPFSVFIIVPFMELLLPIALKLFPGMLPSTFTSQDEREVKMRRALGAKLEYAKFLQQTLDDMGPTSKGHKSQSARDFVSFYQSVKQEGAPVTNKEILKFSKLFEDEITLDNMTRGQLVALCRLLELTPIGTNAFLRFQLEMQLRKLKADDIIISREGIDALSVTELQIASKERGMRALGITKEKLIEQLKQWIELSTNEKVPPSLLLLSRTLYLPESVDPALKIAAAVSALPDSAATGAKARLGEREGKIENVTRLELIKAEQAKIEEEAKEQAKEIEDKQKKMEDKQKKMADEREKLFKISQAALNKAVDERYLGLTPLPSPSAERIVTEAVSILRKATVSAEGEVRHTGEQGSISEDIHVGDVIQEVKQAPVPVSSISKELSPEDLAALKNAIEAITKEKGKTFLQEHEVLLDLKQELTDYEEDLGELAEQAELSGRKDMKQSKGAARLFSRVNKMLKNIDGVVGKLEARKKVLSTQIDVLDNAGAGSKLQQNHLVTVQELLHAVRGLQDVADSSRLERIGEVVARMDDDSDGIVKLEHVNKVIELLGRDNVNLNPKQVQQIIELIGKEEMLEVEGRIEKILGKIPAFDQAKKKIEEQKKKEELVDSAKDLKDPSDPEPEPHIAQLFTRPSRSDTKASESSRTEPLDPASRPEEGELKEKMRLEEDEVSSKVEDNSVKDVTGQVEKETGGVEGGDKEKITQKNGSQH